LLAYQWTRTPSGFSVTEEERVNFDELVILESFSDRSFAEAAVSLLETEGIEAMINADDAGGELPNLDFARGVRVLVSPKDVDRAREVLNTAAEE
jgi:hypothetical protein